MKIINPWAVITIILAVVIVGGGIVIACRYQPAPPLEIILETPPDVTGEIYVSGNVAGPGIYPLRAGDTVAELLRAAGAEDAALLALSVGAANGEPAPQRVDINRADAWLLQSLPGIGDTKARAIVDYRDAHGPFRAVDELARVNGIGLATVDDIRHLVTVAD